MDTKHTKNTTTLMLWPYKRHKLNWVQHHIQNAPKHLALLGLTTAQKPHVLPTFLQTHLTDATDSCQHLTEACWAAALLLSDQPRTHLTTSHTVTRPRLWMPSCTWGRSCSNELAASTSCRSLDLCPSYQTHHREKKKKKERRDSLELKAAAVDSWGNSAATAGQALLLCLLLDDGN